MNRRQRHTLGAIITVVVVCGMFWAFLHAQKKSHYLLQDAEAAKSIQGDAPGVVYFTDFDGKKEPEKAASPAAK